MVSGFARLEVKFYLSDISGILACAHILIDWHLKMIL